jgi:RNA polymerase sigma-54 factor
MLQVQEHSLRPLTTAHLAQTMSLLALSNLDLRDKVLEELNANPALELLDVRVCPTCQRKISGSAPCPTCSARTTKDEPIVFLSPRDSFRPRGMPLEEDERELEPAAPEDMLTYVLQQLAADLEPDERRLAIYIVSSLTDDGFLADPPVIIARSTSSPLSRVQRVTDLISHVDPPGLATSGPRQALLAQLDLFDDTQPLTTLARQILESSFSELARRDYAQIAQRLNVSAKQVRKTAAFIQENLNPFPARAFWGSGRQAPMPEPDVYHVPDIQITCGAEDTEGPLRVEIFSPIAGWLRVSPLFQKALAQTEGESHEECSRYIERASLFVKCLQQRNNTMLRLMKLLVHEQRDFILHGDRYLIPCTRAEMAQRLDVHESTVSRAVAHKAVALPDGRIIPLSRFFERNLPTRDRIREIVANETKPLTDDEISLILQEEGIVVARRTVAKYRALDGILPARLRRCSEDTQEQKANA